MSVPFGLHDDADDRSLYERRRDLWMTGGAASGGGSGQGATVFEPRFQGAADQSLQQLIMPLLGLSANAGAGTPAGQNYPFAQGAVFNDIVNNPFIDQGINASQSAALTGLNQVGPEALQAGGWLNDTANTGLMDASAALSQGFDPRYSQAITDIQNNPYYGTALSGATDAAAMGRTGAGAIQGLAGSIGGQVPQLQGLAGQMGSVVNPLLASGFDPRSALFNRTEGRLMDQTNAINAMSGLGGTPYGASVGANAMSNFDIDWQNQQLARQAQAAGAAGQAAGTAGNLYGQAGQSANTAAGLYGTAPNLLASTSQMPSGVYTQHIGQILDALKAREQGANQGIAGFSSLLGSGGQALTQGNALNTSGLNTINQYGNQPYNTQSTMGQNTLSGLTNLTQLGNNQFALPQQEIGNLMQYMGMGQNASQISGNLGQLGFNQTAQGLGGALSGANTLFGQQGIFGSGGAGGGLFGGGGGSALGGASTLADFGAGGGVAPELGTAAVSAGIDPFAAAAPLALSA
jgi:hypothetical protein